ncbi:RHS repeat-associated core domain-containing protein [Pseudomonas coronafaciens]|uniref:RHS repeat-associated core domain-containing protein n=1 Tax=Pseudomonas coronafaciens TaxID=53409 RepID=UPI0009BE3F8D|nr:RHS repeat-associated core domain-containing protein [Pseudomonas coronafaciens]
MSSARLVVLCTYSYDATDRLASCSPAVQGDTRFFYQKNRLAAQIQGQIQHTLLRTDQHLLAQRRTENSQSDCALLATDQQLSVIAAQGVAFAYTPYGQRHPSAGPMNLPGFAGQRVDPVTGHYLLGNGYRAFNPVLMRFNSPDSFSPFGEGGLNAYAYCAGDPVNRIDSNGHIFEFAKPVLRKMRIIKSPSRVARAESKRLAKIDKHYDEMISAQNRVDVTARFMAMYEELGMSVPQEVANRQQYRINRLSKLAEKVINPPGYEWAALNRSVHAREMPLPTYERAIKNMPSNESLVHMPTYETPIRREGSDGSIQAVRRRR